MIDDNPTKMDDIGRTWLKNREKLRFVPYADSGGVATIGYGNTYYEDGKRVTLADSIITKQRADELFDNILSTFEKFVTNNLKAKVNQNQFNALVSFCYNCGMGFFLTSSLLRLVNQDPNNGKIALGFLDRISVKGTIIPGLVNRRYDEIKTYWT